MLLHLPHASSPKPIRERPTGVGRYANSSDLGNIRGSEGFQSLPGVAARDQHIHTNSQPSVHKWPEGLWTKGPIGKPYDDFGINALIDAIQGDSFFARCPQAFVKLTETRMHGNLAATSPLSTMTSSDVD
jgi:hypothetical protein